MAKRYNNAEYEKQIRKQQLFHKHPIVVHHIRKQLTHTSPIFTPVTNETLATERHIHPKETNPLFNSIANVTITLPNNTYLRLLLILLFFTRNVIAQECGHELTPFQRRDIQKKLHAVMVIEPDMPPSVEKEMTTSCRHLEKRILSVMEEDPDLREIIVPIIFQEGFSIYCQRIETMPKKAIQPVFGKHQRAIFFPLNSLIYDLEDAHIKHEFLHAHNFFLHQTPQCKTDFASSVTPTHPVDENQTEQYNTAFDAGDQRIIELEKLVKKALNIGVLSLSKRQSATRNTSHPPSPLWSKQEDQLLNYYLDAIPTTPATCNWSITTKKHYTSFIKKGWQDGKTNSSFHSSSPTGITTYEVTSIRQFNYNAKVVYQVYSCYIDYLTILLDTPLRVKRALASTYAHLAPNDLLAERETMSFERLTGSMVRLFYSEAHQSKKLYIAQCSDPEWENLYRSSC